MKNKLWFVAGHGRVRTFVTFVAKKQARPRIT